MPLQVENAYAGVSLYLNAILQPGAGYGHVDGCGTVVGDSTSSIECRVSTGVVRHDGDLVGVSTQDVALQPGDPQHPRKDLIYVDRFGDVRAKQGRAAAAVPSDRSGWQTWVPAPPSLTGVDGVAIAVVNVPPGATESGDLSNSTDILDLRVPDTSGILNTRSSDPPQEDLTKSQFWHNTTTDKIHWYSSESDEIRALDDSPVTSFTGSATKVLENFDDSISDNWRGGDSSFEYSTPAFEGSASALWDGPGYTTDWSLPDDGLPQYVDIGDTANLAVYPLADTKRIDLAICKDEDDAQRDIRARLDFEGGRVETVRVDENQTETLGSSSVSASADTWYILEIDYDGGGKGVHPSRLWSTSGSSKDSILAENAAPTKDTTYRGRGVGVHVAVAGRIDRLTKTR